MAGRPPLLLRWLAGLLQTALSPVRRQAGLRPPRSPVLVSSAQVRSLFSAALGHWFLPPGPRPLRAGLCRRVYVRPGAESGDVFHGRCRSGSVSASSRGRRSSFPVSVPRVLPEGGSGDKRRGSSAVTGKRRLRSSGPTQWTQYLPLCLLSPLPRGTRSFWDPCRCSTQPS